MATESIGDRVIGWYGNVAMGSIDSNPDFVRRWLMTGFRLMTEKGKIAPDGRLYRSGQMGNAIFMDSVTRALGDKGGAVFTSIFCPNEIFHALGVHPATAEAVASFASGAQAESGFISFAEGRGVPETYCSYHRILMGMATSGVISRPLMLASTSAVCDANNLTFKTLARHWSCDHYYVDVPIDVTRESVLYVADQLREMAAMAQDCCHARLDEDRLLELCACSMRTDRDLMRTLPARRGRYLANSMTIDEMQMLDLHLMLGTPEVERMVHQMAQDYNQAPRYDGINLVWGHVTPYFVQPIASRLNTSQEAQVVASDMMFSHMPPDEGTFFSAERPYEFMAERVVRNCFNGPATRRAETLRRLADATDADAVVFFCHWGCKQTAGAAQVVRQVLEDAGYPVLVLDGDACDRANCMEGQMGTRFSAFLEMVGAQREERRLERSIR